MCLQLLDGELHTAPLQDLPLHNVLDCGTLLCAHFKKSRLIEAGTGTGIWALVRRIYTVRGNFNSRMLGLWRNSPADPGVGSGPVSDSLMTSLLMRIILLLEIQLIFGL